MLLSSSEQGMLKKSRNVSTLSGKTFSRLSNALHDLMKELLNALSIVRFM